VELPRLDQCVLALIGVEHQQHLVWRVGVDALDDALDLLQLLHEVRLAVQPPGRVGEHHLVPARTRGGQGIEDHCPGVRAR